MAVNENDNEVLTFDEILADPTYQAEFDKRVAKALEKSKVNVDEEVNKKLEAALASREEELRKNIQADIEAKQKEAEENAKLSEAEKYKKELDKVNQKMLGYENQIAVINREKKVKNYIKEKGYDIGIMDFIEISSLTDAQVEAKVDEINDRLATTVSKALDEKLKEDGDIMLGKKNKGEGPSFDFGFQSIK